MCENTLETTLPFWDHRRPAGFRLWGSDAVMLGVTAVATPVLWVLIEPVALLLPLVVGHFFLFCNVFRVHRWSELAWTGLLLLNAAAWLFFGEFTVPRLFLAQSPVTLTVILIALLAPGYKGLGHTVVCRFKRSRESEDGR